MKKLYLDPDIEILNIRLVADVLGASDETPLPTHGGGGDEFEEGGFEEV